MPKIAELLRVDQATVHRWLDRFEADGLADLATQWSDGRPPALDESYEWLAVETVRHDPRWYRLVEVQPAGWLLGREDGHERER